MEADRFAAGFTKLAHKVGELAEEAALVGRRRSLKKKGVAFNKQVLGVRYILGC